MRAVLSLLVLAWGAGPGVGSRPPIRRDVPVVARAPHRLADHVIIISEDGLRPDALARARAPVHDALMREGAHALSARTVRRASTLPSHASMLSGFSVADHGLDWNSWKPERGFIKVPTVFSIVAGAGHGTAAFVGKRKLEHIARPGSIDVFDRPGYFCRKVSERAAAHFAGKRPQVQFVHFSDPDHGGHKEGWMSEGQLQEIAHADKCLARIVDAARRSGVADRTLIIISSDHGGHGRNHSGRKEEDRRIPWIVWGAGVRAGHKITTPIDTTDTAATALWALGYPVPAGAVGKPVLEAFRLR